jgi:carbon storage regulator
MLVLARKVGDTVVIDGRITVKVVELQGNRIKLGFDAPANVSIHRGEVDARISGTEPPVNTSKAFTCLGCFRDFESCSDRPTCRSCGSTSCRKAVAK